MTAPELTYLDAFLEVLAEVEAIHDRARLRFIDPSGADPKQRIGAAWFLPRHDGRPGVANSGVAIDRRSNDPFDGFDGRDLTRVTAWSHDHRAGPGHVEVSVPPAEVTADLIRVMFATAGLLPGGYTYIPGSVTR